MGGEPTGFITNFEVVRWMVWFAEYMALFIMARYPLSFPWHTAQSNLLPVPNGGTTMTRLEVSMRMVKPIALVVCLVTFVGVNFAIAKDLYVSPSGNDSVTYAGNNLASPWLTVAKAFTSVLPGDNVYFRAGNYSITASIDTRFNTNGNGTATFPITFSNYKGEAVTLTSSVGAAIRIDRDYYQIRGFNFSAPGSFWVVGWTLGATHFKISDCTGYVTVPGGGDNFGAVYFATQNANNGRVENCIFHGPGGGLNMNTAGVFIFRSQGIKILNCEFYDIPSAIYYKHTCIAADTGIEFAYNYFRNNGSGIFSVSQYADIHDNILVNSNMGLGMDGGTGDNGANAGADHNKIHHNTFYNCTLELTRASSNDGSGAQYNIVKDNVFTQTAYIFQYDSAPHYSVIDYNLYITGVAVRNNRVSYALASWHTFYGQDSNSKTGTALFAGGSSPSAVADYALATSSPGHLAASDGKDMGADVTLLGGIPVTPPPPAKPSTVTGFKLATTATECLNYNATHPDWIFCDDFESTTPLVATGRYFEYNDNNGDFIQQDGVGVNGSKAMRALWQTGEVDAGSLSLGFGNNPSSYMNKNIHSTENYREIYYRMYMKNETGWQGSPYKLSRASVISGSDWSQAMVAHTWAYDTGNTLAMDPASCVVGGTVRCSGWNDFNNLQWLGKKAGATPIFNTDQAGQWKCIEVHVKLNDPGMSNGIQEFWVDGVLQASSTNLNFTGTYTAYGLNYISFENYWNSGSTRTQARYFDNIVVSESPIGCL